MTTAPIANYVREMLLRDLSALERELERYPSESAVWAVPPGVTNSAGTLALHAAGNLLHYVGALLGETGYVRDRDSEFSTRALRRSELTERLREAADVVDGVLSGLSSDRLKEPFPEPPAAFRDRSTAAVLVHLTTHLSYHLGQVNYHRRIGEADGGR